MKFIHFLLSNRKLHYTLLGIIVFFIIAKIIEYATQPDLTISAHPGGKNFTFTFTDDPDKNNINDKKIVYDFLIEQGIRSTVLVYVKKATKTNMMPIVPIKNYRYGDTLEKEEYREYIKYLQSIGFEIGTHTISAGADYREETLAGYEYFKEVLGQYPKQVIMHSHNLDNLYWGKYIFSNSIVQWILGLFVKVPYGGHIEGNPYFWGDFAQKNVKYVRLWGTTELNTLAYNPNMPYHDPDKKYVNYFYSFSDGYNHEVLMEMLTDENIKEFKEQRGLSIVYTHFAAEFVRDSVLSPGFQEQLIKIASDTTGWFAPASEVLDRLLSLKNIHIEETGDSYLIINANNKAIDGLTLMTSSEESLYNRKTGKEITPNNENELLLGTIEAQEVIILDKKLDIFDSQITFLDLENAYVFLNSSNDSVVDREFIPEDDEELFDNSGNMIQITEGKPFILNTIKPYSVKVYFKDKSLLLKGYTIDFFEFINLVWGRILVFINDGNFLNAKWWKK
jgi:hypothetical protein